MENGCGMLDKYLKFKEFKDWVMHNRFITKLLGDTIFFKLILEDNRHYDIIFYDGEVYSYKFFIFCLDTFNIGKQYYPAMNMKNKYKIEEHEKIIKQFIKNKIIRQEIENHPYHKNAKPRIALRSGENYVSFEELIQNLDVDNIYEIQPVIERAKNELL